jgi:hypothetical protein
MSDKVKNNNLLVYEPLTRDGGPAMTWSMYSIGLLYQRSYENYVRSPFNVSYLNIFSLILGMDRNSIRYWYNSFYNRCWRFFTSFSY